MLGPVRLLWRAGCAPMSASSSMVTSTVPTKRGSALSRPAFEHLLARAVFAHHIHRTIE